MLKTLHWYISRELIRITLLALAVFTLLFTVIVIMEPLRKKGLATGQVAELFIYTLPAMVTLTLPFAALFAVTFTYGRFAQDQELLACRASGISTPTILRPGIGLGLAATVASLILANFVAPASWRAAEEATLSNFKAIAYHVMRKERHVKFGKYVIHATHVDAENDRLVGVVAGERDVERMPDGQVVQVIRAVVASEAYLKIEEMPDPDTPGQSDYYASVNLQNKVGPLSNRSGQQFEGKQIPLEGWKIDDQSQEEVMFYDWRRLLEVYHNPGKHAEIRDEMADIKRLIRYDRVLQGLYEVLKSGRSQTVLHAEEAQVEILAPHVEKVGRARLGLHAVRDETGQLHRVRVRVYRGRKVQEITADAGSIACAYSPMTRTSSITLRLFQDVSMPAPEGGEAPRLDDWAYGEIPLPPDPDLAATSPAEIYQNPTTYTTDKAIINDVGQLQEKALRWRGEAYAEMHARVAFGLLGVLLVTMGAALGVMLRSGQAITALVVSLGPALVGFGSLKMGQRMLANPDASHFGGITVIWGSLVLLLAADIVVYWRLRKV